MTAKEALRKVREINQSLELKEKQLQNIMLFVAPKAKAVSNYDPIRVQVPPLTESAEKTINSIMRMKDKIEQEIIDKSAYKAEMLVKICMIREERLQRLLMLYYFECKDWLTVAKEMDCAITSIYRLNGRALQEFQKFL